MTSQGTPGPVLLTGCSGGGKSTLLAELARRGCATVAEPGRRIVAEERARGGAALPWVDAAAFARRALAMATADLRTASGKGLVFFDRGLVDAAVALAEAGGPAAAETLAPLPRYNARVFLAPPWPEIFAGDADRRHGLDAAVAEYDRIAAVLPLLGYETLLLPKTDVQTRADFVLAQLG